MSGSNDTSIKTLRSHNLSKVFYRSADTDRVCFGVVVVVVFFTFQHLNFHIKHLTQNQRNVDFLRNRRQKAKNSSEEMEVKYNFNRFDSALNKLAFISHAKLKMALPPPKDQHPDCYATQCEPFHGVP